MAVVVLPTLLAREAGGQRRFDVEGATVGDVLRALPVRDLCIDEHGELRRLVNVFVDRVDVRAREGLGTRVEPGSEVVVVTAIAGGSGSVAFADGG